jgi:hypothetical protein
MPRIVSFAGSAHRLGKDVHLDCTLAAIGLRHSGDPYDQHLPDLIDQLTPNGRLPSEEEAHRMV